MNSIIKTLFSALSVLFTYFGTLMRTKLKEVLPEGHFDLDKGFIAIRQEVFGFSAVDSHNTKQQVAWCAEGHLDL